MENLWLVLIGVVSYFLGAVPVSYFICPRIAQEGTGNLGAMSVWRSTHSVVKLFAALVGDAGKGVLAVLLAQGFEFLGYNTGFALMVASSCVVFGHNYSLIFKLFGGRLTAGRGISSMWGVVWVVNWLFAIVSLGVLLLSIMAGEYIEFLCKRKSGWRVRKLTRLIGSQMPGRVAGLALCVALSWVFLPDLYLYLLLPAALVLIRHSNRLKDYLAGRGNT